MKTTIVGLTLLAVVLAGCTGSGGASVKAEYKGEGSGTQTKEAKCDNDGRVTVVSQINEGQITTTVRDGDNKEVFHDTFTGTLDGKSNGMDGKAGEWKLQVDRSSDFVGEYAVTLGC